MRNVSDEKLYRKSIHTFYSQYFFFNRALYGIKWKNMVGPDRPQMTI
jgi:hypothetical protein